MPATSKRNWVDASLLKIEAEMKRSCDTNMLRVDIPATSSISLYIKDESTHPTGSLKHRLARSMFVYALCNGWLDPDTTIVEASSGSTAVSEAYFARLLGLRFVAVVPRNTSIEKLGQIRRYGGECHLVDRPDDAYEASRALALAHHGRYMDQFTFAERVSDWKGSDSIAASIFRQMHGEEHPVPRWIVCGAGTGGTSATIGRYIRYHRLATHVCLADPVSSAFHRAVTGESAAGDPVAHSVIEGIGRSRLEPSFFPELIDRAVPVADAASIAAARVLSRRIGRACGGSTGTNLWVSAQLMSEMIEDGATGSVVTLLCDSGERYRSTLFDDDWLVAQGLDTARLEDELNAFLETGRPLRDRSKSTRHAWPTAKAV
jgi:cysteine synthase A